MAHQHNPRFLQIVQDAKARVREVSVDDIKTRLERGDKFLLVDVREESEYAKNHLRGAVHIGKGVIERDIEARVPDLNAPIVLYCGGGFRSALAADNLQKWDTRTYSPWMVATANGRKNAFHWMTSEISTEALETHSPEVSAVL
jgi:rhodanese-related sulfurtransferase